MKKKQKKTDRERAKKRFEKVTKLEAHWFATQHLNELSEEAASGVIQH